MDTKYPTVGGWFESNELEERTLAFWQREGIFEKVRRKNAEGEPWSLIDGPITANNKMGIHHAWGRSLKDAFQRYRAMNGRRLRYQNGFDCQGLWVEVEVEKELGFTSKHDIEAYGVGRFVERCKQRVLYFADVITEQSKRLGYWMDWDNSYFTMSEENNYAIWAFLKKCHQRELVYRGHDVMPWCPRCGTGLSQHEMSEGYADTTHLSLYVAFPVRRRSAEYLVVWTTTPWTLVANVAVAVNPDLTYAVLSDGTRRYYVQNDRAGVVAALLSQKKIGEDRQVAVERRLAGAELLAMEMTYDGPFDHLPAAAEARAAHRVVPWNEVTAEDGTGLVHIAPGCGEEDNSLGREFGLPAPGPVDESGRFLEGYGALVGRAAGDAADDIAADLQQRGLLVGREQYTHSYPHCWRCGRELIYRLVDEWYIAMDPWREEIRNVVKQITWIPSYGKDLELDWLSNMHDWMISKKRYWGLALPIWVNEDASAFDVLGSREELAARATAGWESFDGHTPHRPWIDDVKILGADGAVLSRIPDVGNPWLDAGIVPYSTTRYSSDRNYWATWVPADLVLESFPGQFRNWFYSLLAMSTMLESKPPFRTLVGHSQVRDENGEEMHKSKGNAIWFDDAVAEVGSDVIRWLFLSHDIRNNINFSFEDAKGIRGRVFNTLWNSHGFFVNYARTIGFNPDEPSPPVSERPVLDRWILSELEDAVTVCRKSFETYETRYAVQRIEEFADSLSNWYIRHSRRRFWRGEGEPAAFHTLYRCLETVCRLIAPVAPMFADEMYRNLTAGSAAAPESVHLADYPTVEEGIGSTGTGDAAGSLSARMAVVIDVTAAAHRARKQAGVKIRQPLATLQIALRTEEDRQAVAELSQLIAAEINVKELDVRPVGDAIPTARTAELDLRKVGPKFGAMTPKVVSAFNRHVAEGLAGLEPGRSTSAGQSDWQDLVVQVDGESVVITADEVRFIETAPPDLSIAEVRGGWVALDTLIDRPLELEGLARDLVRTVQILRRDSGFAVEDRISLAYRTDDADLAEAIDTHIGYLKAELLATDVSPSGAKEPESAADLRIASRAISVWITRSDGSELTAVR